MLPEGVEVVRTYAVPMTERFRGVSVREGVLLRGPAGLGDFCPFPEYPDDVALPWLQAAVEACVTGWPAPVRDRVPVNVTVPAVPAERAYALVAGSGCSTAKVKVAEHPGSDAEDEERVRAVRSALGPGGRVRVDANGRWDVDTAVRAIRRLDVAAAGLEYVEQPCATVAELASVRRVVSVRVAADESIRLAADPLAVARAGAADIAVLKAAPLGGVRRSLAVAQECGLPCVVSSALETSVGLAAQVALAAALPSLDLACGLGTLALFEDDVVPAAQAVRPRGGWVAVSAPSVVLPGPPAASPGWWLQRLTRVAGLL